MEHVTITFTIAELNWLAGVFGNVVWMVNGSWGPTPQTSEWIIAELRRRQAELSDDPAKSAYYEKIVNAAMSLSNKAIDTAANEGAFSPEKGESPLTQLRYVMNGWSDPIDPDENRHTDED